MTDALLLPPKNVSRWEAAHEQTEAARLPLSVSAVRSMADAKLIPLEFLPSLAWGRGVDLWFPDWSEARKREITERAIELHRLKGTIGGAEAYLAFIDGELIAYRTPRNRAFARPAITKAQRDAWLARMPQIRVHLGSAKGEARPNAHAGRSFAGHGIARIELGAALYGRKAVLRYPNGVEEPLKHARIVERVETRTDVQIDRFVVPGAAGPAAFAGNFAGRRFATTRNKQSQIVTYALDRQYDWKTSELHLSTVEPGLDPIDTNYRRVSEIGEAGLSAFDGSFATRRFASRDRGGDLLSDRLYLNDRSADVPWTRGHSFAGHARIGVKRFTAEFQVDLTQRSSRKTSFTNHSDIGGGFATREDLTKFERACEALRVSKAARDKYLIYSQTYRKPTFGDRFKLDGSFRFGRYVRNSF